MALNWVSDTKQMLDAEGANSAGTARDVGAVNVAIPAAGSTAARFCLSTTAAFGIYFGSGAPTVVAAKGSIYLRSDGSSTSTRLYVASDSAGAWVAVTTAS
jgi:hypothetical protein